MEWGIVSYIIRYYFNPCGTGSHLYSANTNTLRSRTLSSRTYTTLVGFAFGFRLASLFCTLIVSQLGRFVKRFLKFLSKDFFTRCAHTLGVLWTPLDFSYIVSQLGGFVKGFSIIFLFFLVALAQTADKP
jgi:hypothetical protein